MKKSGAELAVYALEQIGVKHTFGIPGVHTTELYDALNNSKTIEPILVTHEGGASFMADGVSRTSNSIGTLAIVPAAGTTHALSGIGEAFLDGSPMLIISGGTRRDSGKHYQLHQLDLKQVVSSITKEYFLIESHKDIIPTIYKAYEIATSGEPGPVFIELPVEFQLFSDDVGELPSYKPNKTNSNTAENKLEEALKLLAEAKNPGIYVGWGAVDASEKTQEIAEYLGAPVSTTLQGLSAFPANHPLHVGVGFGPSAVPAAQEAFKNCDCMLAVGVRFSELGTGSYGSQVPENLIHIDINPEVFNKNYPAKVHIEGDALEVLTALSEKIKSKLSNKKDYSKLSHQIKENKQKYFAEWKKEKQSDKVSPGFFFEELRKMMPEDGLMVVDDGKHTFLTAELFPVYQPRGFISPTDFNCMGFCVPAAIGAKLSNPNKQVAAIVGDGAFLMTGMELLTASMYNVGLPIFIFNDGELGQISQFQKIPLNRKTCTILGNPNFEGVALATHSKYLKINNDFEIEEIIKKSFELSEKQPVIVDVNIDYSKKTFLTKGVVKTNLSRFPLNEKIRFIGRALKRHVIG